MRVPRPVRCCQPQLLGKGRSAFLYDLGRSGEDRFLTRHSRQEEIALTSGPRLPISGVDGRHVDGVTGSPR